MEIFNPNSNIDFIGWRRASLVVSLILILASVGLLMTRGLNYALDFTGGMLIEVSYEQPVDAGQVREALAAGGYADAQVQAIGGSKEVAIRLRPSHDTGDAKAPATDAKAPAAGDAVATSDDQQRKQLADSVLKALKAKNPDVKLKRSDFAGPQVGAELREQGIIAVLFVILGIMLYIMVRFEWRFAVAAVAAEFHDTLLTVGFLALIGHEFDLTVLAAVLSVVGYSINDKVVVFDRVREIFRSGRKLEPAEVMNKAVNSTLSRTIITAFTTSLALVPLYVVGGPAVAGFGLTMLVGIVIGTLSSIFFANPILLWLGVSKRDLMPKAKDTSELERRP